MSAHLRVLALPVAMSAVYLAFASPASAGTTAISGTVPNGGCDTARPVPVSGPSRIEIEAASTSAGNTVFGEIVAPDGRVVATGRYDTPGGGSYSVRVCSVGEGMNPSQMQYSGAVGTGPAGQAVLTGATQPEPAAGGVLGVTTTIGQRVTGKGAISTRAGLAWFTLNTTPAGQASIRVYDPVHRLTRVVKGLHATYGARTIRITGNGLQLVLTHAGSKNRITFMSSSFKARGTVVRGGFQIVA